MDSPKVAYFCMEFGLHDDFKIYSGGLGVLAGDFLKAAKDLNLPVVGVGILWRQGYVSQRIEDGKVVDCFREYRYDTLEDTGIKVSLEIRKRKVNCKVWKCEAYGNVPLYLLDAFLPQNSDALITGQLYGWFAEERIAQEMILGVGGVRALRALGLEIDFYHFNDSHAVLAGFELIREKMQQGLSFEEALYNVKQHIVFTTHTPVEAGNEVHRHELLSYMGAYNSLSFEQARKIGNDPFSMTVAGLSLCGAANGVAKLHGETARKMWADFGGEKIIGITNGVHNGTWQDNGIEQLKGTALLERHRRLKKQLLDEIEIRTGKILSKKILTIGFARRAAGYKRGTLLFSDVQRLEAIFEKGLQIIFAGKAHPNDLQGKAIVEQMAEMAVKYPNVVFLQDYSMRLGALLTRGCDVWLNNPKRPMEACGTSGMKAAMNGVLNLSILDGWWPEMCQDGINGWKIGENTESDDGNDAGLLYERLENDVMESYQNPQKWAEMMEKSIEDSSWAFCAQRMVKQYYELLYRR